MIFRNSYQSAKAMQLINGDLSELAGMLGVPVSGLNVYGTNTLKEITVYTCCKILAETLAKLPLKIYQDTPQGKEKLSGDYRSQLLRLRPNPYMSAFDFWRALEVNRNLDGNAYAYIDVAKQGRNAGKIQGLYPLKSENMRVYVDDCGLLSSKNRVWYEYYDNNGHSQLMDSDSVLHFKGLNTDGLLGLSVVETLKTSIENAKNSQTFLNNSYKKGMMVSGVLQYIGDLDEDGRNDIRNKFEKMSSGMVNANRIAVMPLGMKFEPFQMKLTDAQFLENSRFTLQQLTAAYGIKPHQVNDQSKTSYASTSEANREFYTDTFMAVLAIYEQEMDYKLFLQNEIDSGVYTKFNADVILRADPEKRYESYKTAVQNMILTPNECREKEDLKQMPGGNMLYGNSTLAPATLLAEGIAFKKGGEKQNG
ncbi:MAG: phage portal protein [Ruminococcaceae bacterium]|nr:phage portal protein [Oscillospiraceae bacterium]